MIALHDVSIAHRLKHVSLTLQPNEFWCVIGPNGAGKSSLLETIAGSIHPTSGSLSYQNQPYPSAKQLAKIRAVLPQSISLPPHFTGQELLLNFSPDKAKEKINEVVELLDLSPLLTIDCQKLSGGQAQRLMLGKTILQLLSYADQQQAQYLLLDEAASALDIHRQKQMLQALKTLQQRYHWGIVLLSHDFTMSATFADKMLMMQNQSIAYQGTVKEVLTPNHLSQVFQCPFDAFQNTSGQVIYSPSE